MVSERVKGASPAGKAGGAGGAANVTVRSDCTTTPPGFQPPPRRVALMRLAGLSVMNWGLWLVRRAEREYRRGVRR